MGAPFGSSIALFTVLTVNPSKPLKKMTISASPAAYRWPKSYWGDVYPWKEEHWHELEIIRDNRYRNQVSLNGLVTKPLVRQWVDNRLPE